MKISLFTGCLSTYDIEHSFALAQEIGYDGIDLGGFRPHAYPFDLKNGGVEKILNLSRKYNMPIISYIPENTGSPYSLVFEDEKMNEESLEYFKLSIKMAKEINAKYCMLACNHPGSNRNKKDVQDLFISNMKILAKYAQEIGQVIILEPVTPYEGTILVTSDDVKWALDEINNEYVKCVLDLAAPFTVGESVSEYFNKMKDEIVQIHFIDCEASSEDHLIPGDGDIDFPNLVSYLHEIKFDGYLTLELFSRYATERDFSVKRGYKEIKRLLSEN